METIFEAFALAGVMKFVAEQLCEANWYNREGEKVGIGLAWAGALTARYGEV